MSTQKAKSKLIVLVVFPLDTCKGVSKRKFACEVRHFSNSHLVLQLFSCYLRLSNLNFLTSFQDTDVSFSACPPLPFQIPFSYESLNPKLTEMLPLTSRGFGWVWMRPGDQISCTIKLFPLLCLVFGQGMNLFPSSLPSAKCLDVFFMNLPLQIYHITQSENRQNDTVVVTFIVH